MTGKSISMIDMLAKTLLNTMGQQKTKTIRFPLLPRLMTPGAAGAAFRTARACAGCMMMESLYRSILYLRHRRHFAPPTLSPRSGRSTLEAIPTYLSRTNGMAVATVHLCAPAG